MTTQNRLNNGNIALQTATTLQRTTYVMDMHDSDNNKLLQAALYA